MLVNLTRFAKKIVHYNVPIVLLLLFQNKNIRLNHRIHVFCGLNAGTTSILLEHWLKMTAKTLLSQIGRILVLNSTNIIPRAAVREFKSTATFLTAFNKKTNDYVRHYSSQVINDIPIVTYDEVKQLPKYPKKLLIDVREPNELQETGQIPSSINIPLGQVAEELSTNMDEGIFKAKYGRDKPDVNTEIIFHCKIGRRSQNAAELAKSLGYKNSKNYLGSWTEWAEKEGLNK